MESRGAKEEERQVEPSTETREWVEKDWSTQWEGPGSWRLKLLLLHKANTKQNQKLNVSSGFSLQSSVPEQAVIFMFVLRFAGDFLSVLRDGRLYPAPNNMVNNCIRLSKGSSHL